MTNERLPPLPPSLVQAVQAVVANPSLMAAVQRAVQTAMRKSAGHVDEGDLIRAAVEAGFAQGMIHAIQIPSGVDDDGDYYVWRDDTQWARIIRQDR